MSLKCLGCDYLLSDLDATKKCREFEYQYSKKLFFTKLFAVNKYRFSSLQYLLKSGIRSQILNQVEYPCPKCKTIKIWAE